MIEKNGVLIHVDAKGDRTGKSDFEFDGWVAAESPIKRVWLPACGLAGLTTSERPDVRRVFPSLTPLGFSGSVREREIGAGGLRIAVQVGEETLEVDYGLPPPLAQASLRKRMVTALRLAWCVLRERLTNDTERRWQFVLRRHLLYRERRCGIFRRAHTDALLSDFATAVPQAVFLQIGANDGFTGDPINHLLSRADVKWSGVLVEPVAHLFAQLSERYASYPALRLERAAITQTDGTTVIHRFETRAEDSLWLDQLPSLNPALLEQTARQFGASAKRVSAETVPSLCVATLLARHHLAALDLLVIDAEGWDWRILRQFNLMKIRPKLILYEHQHLAAVEREQAHQFLAQHSYGWAQTEEGDTIAWRLF